MFNYFITANPAFITSDYLHVQLFLWTRVILICEYSNTSKDSEKSILHNDRIDASERSSLTVFWEIYSLKYPIAEYVRSLQSKTPAEKKKTWWCFNVALKDYVWLESHSIYTMH